MLFTGYMSPSNHVDISGEGYSPPADSEAGAIMHIARSLRGFVLELVDLDGIEREVQGLRRFAVGKQ